jgi:DNA end-binding protein Ku
MGHTVFSGYLSLGLVSAPVEAICAARPETISFNMLHRGCDARVNQILKCQKCDTVIERKDTEKGYEIKRGKEKSYLKFTYEELKDCLPSSSETMEILQCVKQDEIDPVLMAASYFLAPQEAGRRAYGLILQALIDAELYALAKLTKNSREHVVVIRPFENRYLAFHEIFYEDEVRERPALQPMPVKPEELRMATALLGQITKPFDHSTFADEYRAKVSALIEAKRQGQPIPINLHRPAAAPAMDLLEALQASLKPQGKPVVRKQTRKSA